MQRTKILETAMTTQVNTLVGSTIDPTHQKLKDGLPDMTWRSI